LSEYTKNNYDIHDLSPSDSFVLNKLKATYQEQENKNAGQALAFDFAKDIDRKVYNNLVQRLTFIVLEINQNVNKQEKANNLRAKLGIPLKKINKEGLLIPEVENATALQKLHELIEVRATKSRNPLALRNLFAYIKQENDKAKIAEILLNEINQQKRQANYTINTNYTKAWEYAIKDQTLPNKAESGWIYRGNFSTKDQPTKTRGSLNITLDENAIMELDALIKNGIINANYKFGEPGTGAEASERHDAVTIYFLTEPTPEAKQKISEIAKKYFRGNDLIGRKISDGFFMSEIGSISDRYASELIQQIQGIDPKLSKALKIFLTSNKTGKERVAMSEAQYYSAKEMLKLFDVDVDYNKDKGFKIIKNYRK